jgi:hypothetical protein
MLAVAIEAYQLEFKVPAPEAGMGPFPPLVINGHSGQTAILTPALTTPVAYTSSFLLRDPFLFHDAFPLYVYECYNWMWCYYDDAMLFPSGDQLNGYEFKYYYNRWRLFSLGPDKEYDNIPGGSQYSTPAPVGMPYDPTNGTISSGNIIRSQKYPEQKTWKDFLFY